MMTALTTIGMESEVARLALSDKDVSCGNNEPDKSVIDMGAEEDSELDSESQYLVLQRQDWYLLLFEIQIQNKLKLSS